MCSFSCFVSNVTELSILNDTIRAGSNGLLENLYSLLDEVVWPVLDISSNLFSENLRF